MLADCDFFAECEFLQDSSMIIDDNFSYKSITLGISVQSSIVLVVIDIDRFT